MVTVNSALQGSGGTVAKVMDFAFSGNAPVDVADYVAELHRLCERLGLDFRILVTQSYHECFNPASGMAWDSFWWKSRRNPAGIGITGDPEQDAASHTWATGVDAARGHAAHMTAYVFGQEVHSRFAALGIDALSVNPRVAHVLNQPWAGTVRTLGDLTGKWATDSRYAEKIVERANAMFDGHVPVTGQPDMFDLMRDFQRFGVTAEVANIVRGRRSENRNGHRPEFIVLHIQEGGTKGSLEHWSVHRASSTVMIQKDGSILQVILEQHAPWTNGQVKNPSARGIRLNSLSGDPNNHTLSIEAEGMTGNDVTPAELDAIEWQVRDWMNRYGIPLDNVLKHADIDSVDRPNCPGAYYDTIVARLRTAPRPAFPSPAPISWSPGDLGWKTLNGLPVFVLTAEVTALKTAVRRVTASNNAEKAGENLAKGTTARAIGSFSIPRTRPDGRMVNERWVILDDCSRVRGSSLSPALPIKP